MMKKYMLKVLCLTLLSMMVNIAVAQHVVNAVQPGCDGDLPALPEIPEPEEGRFGPLILNKFYLEMDYMISYYDFTKLAVLEFPDVKEYGGDYYVIEVLDRDDPTSQWKVIPGDSKSIYSRHATQLKIESSGNVNFRLRISGGPKDGWLSNEVEVPFFMTVNPVWVSEGYSQPNFIAVGLPVYPHYVGMREIGKDSEGRSIPKDVNRSDIISHLFWYRLNPKTGEMTSLKKDDNERQTYTPTLDDVGYEIVSALRGDWGNLDDYSSMLKGRDFYSTHSHGVVQLPIFTSTEMMNDEGAVINTNYVLPEPEKHMWIYNNSEGQPVAFPESAVKTIKPGQYSVRLNTQENIYTPWGYGESPYILCMSSPAWMSFREFMLIDQQLIPVPIVVKKDGQYIIDVVIGIYGLNLDGRIALFKTIKPETTRAEGDDHIIVELPAGTYYFVAFESSTGASLPEFISENTGVAISFNEMDYYEKFSDPTFAFTVQVQDPTGISSVQTVPSVSERYSLGGQRVNASHRGLVIMRTNDGQMKKVMVTQ